MTDLSWSTNTDWTGAQSTTNIDINSGTFELADAIPDSGDLHSRYDWREASGTSTVTDQTGNGRDLSGSYSGPNESINGVQAGEFDGTDDVLETTFTSVSQPYTVAGVFRFRSLPSSSTYLIDAASNNESAFRHSGGEWAINSSSSVFGGESDTNDHIFVILFDGANSELFIDGTSVLSGDAGTLGLDGHTIGSAGDGESHADAAIGELLYYPQDKTGIRSDIESYLDDNWGPIL